MIAFIADLLGLSPTAISVMLVVFVLLAVSVRPVCRYVCDYLKHRSDNKLIAKHLEKSDGQPDSAVIQAIRGTVIADAAKATSEAEVIDAEVEGTVKRLTGWLRDLKPPGGG